MEKYKFREKFVGKLLALDDDRVWVLNPSYFRVMLSFIFRKNYLEGLQSNQRYKVLIEWDLFKTYHK